MYERIAMLGRVAEVDVARTRAYYDRSPSIAQSCGCGNCRNFVQVVDHLPGELIQLLERIGVDPTKEGEVMEFGRNSDGTISYGAFFHVVGTLLDAAPIRWFPIGNGFLASLTSETELVPADFPRPVFQLDVQGSLPWVLDEPYE